MRKLLTSGIFVVFCFLTLVILAQVPQLLNYQGRLTDDAGTPIITPTTVRFSLYQGGDTATPGSGTLVYREDASVTSDGNGVFSHLIGSGMVIYGALDSTVFQTADPVYLEITVDPAGANETLLPRKQIVTVGYSFKSELADDADTVDGQDASAFAPVAHNHDPDYVNEGQADSVNSAMIVDGTIVDADINAGANIAASKIDRTSLDADLLDGKDSEDFVHTAGDDMTGTLDVNTSSTYALIGKSSSTSGRGVYGYASATSGTTYGVYARILSSNGYAVYGTAPTYGVFGDATASSGYTYGVYGTSVSNNGYGVYGVAPKIGVCGESPLYGVRGYASATSGPNFGVYGISASTIGYGVYGYAPYIGLYGVATAASDTNYGVYGQSPSTSGYGVYGAATAISGTTYGVYGYSHSSSGYGVYGKARVFGVFGEASDTMGENYGVWGQSASTNGYGVYGSAPTYAVYGVATSTSTNYGVYGLSVSSSGTGVYGEATATSGANYGVYGTTASTSDFASGVYGYASGASGATRGVYGKSDSTNGYAVYGQAISTSGFTFGVYGESNSILGFGVYGLNPVGGYAGYFNGKVHVDGKFTASGTKTCVQPIDNGKKVLLYAMESPEIWFEDFGSAQLVNGQAVVPVEKIFAQTANIEMGYLIFLTPIGECNGLYISRQDKDSFEVRELGGGTSSISFYYRIVAKRRGYEEVRFEEFAEPEQTPAEPNLPVEKK